MVATRSEEGMVTNETLFETQLSSTPTIQDEQDLFSFNDLNLPSVGDIKPITGKFDWSKDDLLESPFWGLELTESDLQEIKDALAVCKAEGSGLDLQDGWQPLGVTQENFPLKNLATKLTKMAEELENGTGAVMIKNIPVKEYSIEDVGIIYAGINSYIGRWIPQSSAGLRSKSRGFGLPLGRVEAEMVGNTPRNGLQANNYFRLHTDRCDVITLMCIRPAPAGGASRVCSAVRVHNNMLQEFPQLCARLYRPYYRIWEGVNGYFELPVWSAEKGKFTSQVSPSYIENAQVLPDVPKLDEEGIEAIDIIEEIGLRESVDFMMQPGMVYWLNNHVVYHGRDSWRFNGDAAESKEGGDGGRLMLRMWLSPFNTRALPNTDRYKLVWGNTEAGVPRGGLEPAIKSGLTPKRDELINAVNSGKVDYYGMFRRKFGVDAAQV
ncbi:hypothetical protein ACA910_015087 [Epithemia clementina (nom. ined.)]